MAKITLSSLTAAFSSIAKLNANFTALAAELNNKVLYRDNPTGETNSMENSLDMNSNDIENVGTITTTALVLDGETITTSTTLAAASPGTVQGNVLVDNTVDGDKILTNSIPGTKLEDASVDLAGTKVTGVLPKANLPSGTFLQMQVHENATYASILTQIPVDGTTPLISEGTELLTKAITMRASGNKIVGHVTIPLHCPVDDNAVAAVFRDSTCIWAAVIRDKDATAATDMRSFSFYDAPATASAVTYSVRVGPGSTSTSGTPAVKVNGGAGASLINGLEVSCLVLTEVQA